ncbi:HD-GYP domain-containing protein [Halonatronum saccharophilum]|uniref:HD-GYP domain-containing protein n=1 Tax=Halonatronum saccharophilum TaxID=150060 RepID=UPI000486B0CB|nr:HD domain-containing phosphohydrolase [Halonatronum saccharophilum]
MEDKMIIPLYDLIFSISGVVDMVDFKLKDHHEKVAYISYRLATELEIDTKDKKDLVIAAAIHDIGSFSRKDNLERLKFDNYENSNHAKRGAYLVNNFSLLAKLAPIISYHHLDWNCGDRQMIGSNRISLLSNILQLADRISLLVDNDNILANRDKIVSRIKEAIGRKFNPDFVESFLTLSKREEFWLSIINSKLIEKELKHFFVQNDLKVDLAGLEELGQFYSKIIDFRSSFTANHSKGVALTAAHLAKLCGWSDKEVKKMEIAGYLHDLGKLAIPVEILDKPGKLTKEEFSIIKSHTFYTYHTLDSIEALKEIKEWAAFHHERLDGKGYPFRLSEGDLSLGSRIMAVADIFTALTEDRPYRKGMKRKKVLSIMKSMVSNGAIDGSLVEILENNYSFIDKLRKEAQKLEEERKKMLV